MKKISHIDLLFSQEQPLREKKNKFLSVLNEYEILIENKEDFR